MNKSAYASLTVIALFFMFFAVSPAISATYYPDDGDLWYNGSYYADSYLKWNYPGGWSVSDPGYEHDFATSKNYFNKCTSWTNLPYGYNDCPTAGVSEPSSYWTFSFGSYHIKNVTAKKWYFGSWNFSGGYLLSSTFYLNGQENKHQFCWYDSIWCMGGTRSQRLTSGTLNWGSTLYRSW
jgi:hypothetical protein